MKLIKKIKQKFNYEANTVKTIEKYLLLYSKGKTMRAKILFNRLKKRCSCNIYPSAKFGNNIYIAHPNNITIGATSILGNNILIFQGVQLVSKVIYDTGGGIRRHPMIGNNCILCANCCVVGDITIGNNCIIGAGAIVTKSVPDNSVVLNVNEIRENKHNNQEIIFARRNNNKMMFLDDDL